jgi:hypothetical protein
MGARVSRIEGLKEGMNEFRVSGFGFRVSGFGSISSYKLVIKGLSVYAFAFSLRDFFYFAPFARKNAYEFHAKTAKRRTQRKDKARKVLPKGLVIKLIYNILDDIGFEFQVTSSNPLIPKSSSTFTLPHFLTCHYPSILQSFKPSFLQSFIP